MEWEKIELELDVKDMLDVLPERLKQIVIKRFFEFKVRRVIASEMGVSIERIRQLESKALWKIRRKFRRNPNLSESIKEYYLG
jgi:RNA polymerase sigma factor (sigma-70 family)